MLTTMPSTLSSSVPVSTTIFVTPDKLPGTIAGLSQQKASPTLSQQDRQGSLPTTMINIFVVPTTEATAKVTNTAPTSSYGLPSPQTLSATNRPDVFSFQTVESTPPASSSSTYTTLPSNPPRPSNQSVAPYTLNSLTSGVDNPYDIALKQLFFQAPPNDAAKEQPTASNNSAFSTLPANQSSGNQTAANNTPSSDAANKANADLEALMAQLNSMMDPKNTTTPPTANPANTSPSTMDAMMQNTRHSQSNSNTTTQQSANSPIQSQQVAALQQSLLTHLDNADQASSDQMTLLEDAYMRAVEARTEAEKARLDYLNLANTIDQLAYTSHQTIANTPTAQTDNVNTSTTMSQSQMNAWTTAPWDAPQNQGFSQTTTQAPSTSEQTTRDPWSSLMNAPSDSTTRSAQFPQQTMTDPFATQNTTPTAPNAASSFNNSATISQTPPTFAPDALTTSYPMSRLHDKPISDLTTLVAQTGQTTEVLQDKVDAMEELGIRGMGTPETYDALLKEALRVEPNITDNRLKDDLSYIRRVSLWTLGMMNRHQNQSVPTNQLPGLNVIDQILRDKNEDPNVKVAAIQSLQVLNRETDPLIQAELKEAKRNSKHPDVMRVADQAARGERIPLPEESRAAG